jgi:hypothetical protein
MISSDIATIWMAFDNSTNTYVNNVAFGGIPNNIGGKFHSSPSYSGLIDSGIWAWEMDWAKMGGTEIINERGSLAIFDNSQWDILLPVNVWNDYFIPMVNQSPDLFCSLTSCYNDHLTCDQIDLTQLDSLVLKLGLNELTIPPSAYAFTQGLTCVLSVSSTTLYTKDVFLGGSFFNNFVVSFDYSKSSISVATSQLNSASGANAHHKLSAGWYFGMIAGSLALLTAVLCLTVFRKKKKDEQEDQE